MPETYTHENFEPSVVPSGFKREVKDVIRVAVSVGWKLIVTAKGHVTLIAPPPNERITINLSPRKTDGPLNQMKSKITKYANPLMMPDEAHADEAEKRLKANEVRAAAERRQNERRIEAQIAEAAERAQAAVAARTAESSVATESPRYIEHGGLVIDTKVTSADRDERTIVSEGPMIARRSRGRGYPSEVATQREWSDGTVEYVCTVPTCTAALDGGPYVTENRLAMGPHRKAHINSGEVGPTEQDRTLQVDVPEHEPAYTKGDYSPRTERLRSLSSVLLEQLIALGPDLTDHERADALAAAALQWGHTRSDGGLGRGEREPLSDAELLARIRGLIDNGLYQRQADEMDALRAAKDEADRLASEARAETDKVRSDVSGLLDLLAEYRTTQTESTQTG